MTRIILDWHDAGAADDAGDDAEKSTDVTSIFMSSAWLQMFTKKKIRHTTMVTVVLMMDDDIDDRRDHAAEQGM